MPLARRHPAGVEDYFSIQGKHGETSERSGKAHHKQPTLYAVQMSNDGDSCMYNGGE